MLALYMHVFGMLVAGELQAVIVADDSTFCGFSDDTF